MRKGTISKLGLLFAVLFGIVALRQTYVQLVRGPQIAAKPYNPRHALLAVRRGRILASDGSILAQTVAGRRTYSYAESLAQTVGYVSARYGTSGLEDAYDAALTPPDTTGDVASQIAQIEEAFGGRNAVARGADVVTTLVPAVQQALYSGLSQHPRAAGIVLDPRSGAVMAIASVPSFDPNSLDQDFQTLVHNGGSPLLNRAIDGLYPPGSTFKIFTASAALDSGTVSMQSTFYDPGYYTIGDFTLHDNEGEATGTQDLTGAFALSSNVDFGQITLKMGTEVFYRYIDRWGIGKPFDFQLPAAPASVPPQRTIVPGELAQMGFGQGALLMTPLQMALLAATIAEGGFEPRPYIVRQVVRQGGGASAYGAAALTDPIAADTAANVKKMMIAVVQRGTGTPAQLPGVTVAGKTGTATNPFGASHSWFVCFAPANRPRVVVAVIVENAGYGATVAAPIAREVLRTALKATL